MNKQLFFILVIFAVFLSVFTGCMKKQSYSIVPEISLQSFELMYDTGKYPKSGILNFSYQDGDGDIGLYSWDTFPPYHRNGDYYYNLVINYFEKQNGVFVPVNLTIPFSARIPVLTPNDPDKAIKGFIEETLALYPPPPHDTIKFEVFIYDRALHKSNVITTPEIILKRR
jgi:hypothetical protein